MTSNNTAAFIQRLNKFCKYNGMTVAQLQNLLGKSNSYFRNTFESAGYIRRDIWQEVKDKVDPLLNVQWLEKGEGEMHLENKVEVTATVPLLPVTAQGGSLTDFEVQVMEYNCERVISPVREAELAISVTGDSMSPEFPNGCKVFIKRINEAAFIDWGHTYVLDTVNGVVIKNVFPCKDNNEKVVCHSVNPNFPDYEVYKSDIRGWYRVLAQIALK